MPLSKLLCTDWFTETVAALSSMSFILIHFATLIVLHFTCSHSQGTASHQLVHWNFGSFASDFNYFLFTSVLLPHCALHIQTCLWTPSHRLVHWNCNNFICISCIIIYVPALLIVLFTCSHFSVNCFTPVGTLKLWQLLLNVLYIHLLRQSYYTTLYMFTLLQKLLHSSWYNETVTASCGCIVYLLISALLLWYTFHVHTSLGTASHRLAH
jgi:hypothetical protein